MKKIIGVVLMASLALTFITGCKGKDSVANDPKSVVVAFFERKLRFFCKNAAIMTIIKVDLSNLQCATIQSRARTTRTGFVF